MTVRYIELHLANNIEALRCLAKSSLQDVMECRKFERICHNLDLLLKNAQGSLVDQEKTYVYLYRFLLVYDHYYKGMKDKKFMDIRFEKDVEKTKKQMKQLENDLSLRYKEKEEGRKPLKKTTVTSVAIKFPENEISCEELYHVLQDLSNNILLVDARPSRDFLESRMKADKLINVPDEIIQSGMSAHLIGTFLPFETQAVWDARDSFDILVLFDWRSTFESITATKLQKLLSAVRDWDTNKSYPQKPIILRGGYMEWGEKYPSLCVNPSAVMNKFNDGLEELLDLDTVEYPDDSKVIVDVPDDSADTSTSSTREELIHRQLELSAQKDKILNEIISEENKWKNNQHSAQAQKEHEKRIAFLDEQLQELTDQTISTQEEFELYAQFDPKNEKLNSEELIEIADSDKTEDDKIRIRETVAQDRLDALAKARSLKPKAAGDPNVPQAPVTATVVSPKDPKPDTPAVNRTNKPATVTPHKLFDDPINYNPGGGGLIGLKNIRNTCYMNTVIQCIRNVPRLARLFCSGVYRREIRRKPDAIIMATGLLFRQLWSNFDKCINPIRFYEQICLIEPNYRQGSHEDCMEFFLFLLNNLSEDCAYDMKKEENMATAQQAWFNQLGGRKSIFTDIFYHQICITQLCIPCDIKTYKFEMESTFMLPVPEKDFYLEDLMRNYLQDYVIEEYCCSKCKKPVGNSKRVRRAPLVLVIVLKRYKQVNTPNGNTTVSKIGSRCFFPTATNFIFEDVKYYLNAIAMHSGTVSSGHYTAACFTNSKWYEFNDEIVRTMNIDDDLVRSKACAFFYSTEVSM